MERRQLGREGPPVPVICFGAWPIGGGMGHIDDAVAIATVQRAVDIGVAFVDTAEAYRTSEDLVGRALQGRRDRVFLATKVRGNDLSRRHILSAIESSLRALRTDYVDLYQAHSWDERHPIEETMRALDDLVRDGKVRYVGVSNFSVPQLEQALAVCPVASLQPRYNMLAREADQETLPFCHAHGIGVIVHSPLAKGLLTGKYGPDATFPADDERSRLPDFQGDAYRRYLAIVDRLRAFAQARGRGLIELAIAWTLANPAVTSCIVGAKRPDQLDAHVRAADWRLSPDDLAEIDRLLAA
jgi:aryl-alcohol dehydrogenase-like predicted oxidoreductase